MWSSGGTLSHLTRCPVFSDTNLKDLLLMEIQAMIGEEKYREIMTSIEDGPATSLDIFDGDSSAWHRCRSLGRVPLPP
jgi:hypothetical protein